MKEKTHNIFYNIENLINGMVYRGIHSTNNINDGYMGSGIKINNAIKKYGKENFKKTILFDYSTRKEAVSKEIEMVNNSFINSKQTYNINLGGDIDCPYPEDRNIRISKSLMGIVRSKKTRNKISKTLKEHCVSDDVKNKISIGLKKYYQNHNGHSKGKKMSDEHKKKLSISHLGKNINNTIAKGRIHITNGICNKMIYPNDLNKYVGWEKGRTLKKRGKI